MTRLALLLASHLVALAIGFAAGIYLLPILIAPDAPAIGEIDRLVQEALYKGEFKRELAGSDALHWGEGTVAIGARAITFKGRLAPGPDYKLYLSPGFVETEAEFEQLKPRMARVGDVKTFHNFVVPLPQEVDPAGFDTVVVWCESFRQFITAARYR